MRPLRHPRDLRPVPEPQVSGTRLRVFAGVVFLLLVLLISRLWYLQILQGDRFRLAAEANRSRRIPLLAPRGAIVDQRGRVLVTNRAQFTVYVVPADLPKAENARRALFAELSRTLQITPEALTQAIKRNHGSGSDPIPIAEGVKMPILARITENRLRLPGVIAQAEPVRHYPHGTLAAHLLGYIGQVNEAELARKENQDLGYRPGLFIGKSGVENEYDRFLCGKEGGALYEIDVRGRRKRALGVEDPVAGATLKLCLNYEVQAAAEKALAGHLGAAVALDPRDGSVLALASSPAYDPNLFTRRPLPVADYRALMDPRRNYPLLNRAISSPQPPGSTFKIVTATAGLMTGAITPHTTDYCRGGIPLGRRIKKCHSRHGSVNLDSAIAASCDVFFYHAGWRIRPTPLAQWAEAFGLGQKTGIDLPTEKAGTVPSPAWKAIMAPKFGNPDSGWYPGDTANMAIGQGDLQTTPLQMALVAAAVANQGVIYKPRTVDAAIGRDKRVLYRTKPEVLHRLPVSSAALRLVAQGMRSVVAGPRGTSHRANLEGIAVAGKSGSAETRGGGPTHAWFICYAPYEKPTIAVCVFLESNGKRLHGGADAAPVARALMAAYFKTGERPAPTRGGARLD